MVVQGERSRRARRSIERRIGKAGLESRNEARDGQTGRTGIWLGGGVFRAVGCLQWVVRGESCIFDLVCAVRHLK